MSVFVMPAACLFVSSAPVATCYQGPDDPGNDPPAEPILVPQDKVNALVAEERRKAESKAKAQFQKLEQQLKELQESKTATEAEKDQKVAEMRDEIAAQYQSKEETILKQAQKTEQEWKAKYESKDKEAQDWNAKYINTVVDYELQRAVSDSDAIKGKSVMEILRPRTKFVEAMDEKTGKPTGEGPRPMVELQTQNETGESESKLYSPVAAVKLMREMDDYAHLFKSGAVGGLAAAASAYGQAIGPGGKLDPSKLTSEEYARIRREKPELLGLKPRR